MTQNPIYTDTGMSQNPIYTDTRCFFSSSLELPRSVVWLYLGEQRPDDRELACFRSPAISTSSLCVYHFVCLQVSLYIDSNKMVSRMKCICNFNITSGVLW